MPINLKTVLMGALLIASINTHAEPAKQAPAQSPAIVAQAEEFSRLGLRASYNEKRTLLYSILARGMCSTRKMSSLRPSSNSL
jgi:hypothetical protein